MVDFACKLPWPETFLNPESRRLLLLVVTMVVVFVLVLLNNLRPIVMAASLSIFALGLSFVILLIYGFVHYKLTWKSSFLFPISAATLFSSMGTPGYSLGFNFSFLSFYVRFLSGPHAERDEPQAGEGGKARDGVRRRWHLLRVGAAADAGAALLQREGGRHPAERADDDPLARARRRHREPDDVLVGAAVVSCLRPADQRGAGGEQWGRDEGVRRS